MPLAEYLLRQRRARIFLKQMDLLETACATIQANMLWILHNPQRTPLEWAIEALKSQ
jgi:hypothetical protein